ncbi:hypothetical protein QFZ96_001932 [Paraburkholderia youngii]
MQISLRRISMLFDAGSFVDHDPGAETLLSLRHSHPLKGRWKAVQHYAQGAALRCCETFANPA